MTSARVTPKRIATTALALGATCCTACTLAVTSCAKPSQGFGDPVGVRLEGAPGKGALEMAVALTRSAGTPTPNQVAAALAAAQKGCPELTELGRGAELMRVEMDVRGGRLASSGSVPSEPLALCVVRTIDGLTMGTGGTDGAVALIELRDAQPVR